MDLTSSTQEIPEAPLVPRHIAIIMDGNGRWATSRYLPRVTGHVKGVEAVRGVPPLCTQHHNRMAARTRAAAGEWEGVSVTFAPDGAAQQLPEHYVPQAYRDWGVELYDWQTQCSCCATDEQVTARGGRLQALLGRRLAAAGVELGTACNAMPRSPRQPAPHLHQIGVCSSRACCGG